jgi:hypothetical protein
MHDYDEEQARLRKEAEIPLNRVVGETKNDCAAWLAGQFEDPGCPMLTRDQFFDAAKRRFGGRLSERAFLEVWAAVTEDYPERSKSGPRRKKASTPR